MALPVAQKIWTISANNRVVFVSLNDTMGTILKGIADFLLAHGYTCKGSCDGVTGAMDGVNRWTTVGNASVRGANTTTANSWMTLTDANGCNFLMSYVGGTDDIARISFSPTGNYVAAGTPNQTPTSTTELVLFSGTSLIASTTSLDRIWNGWVDSTSKLCRFVILRSTKVITSFGMELVSSRTTVTFSPAVWGFAYIGPSFIYTSVGSGFMTSYTANNRGGQARVNAIACSLGGGAEIFLGNSIAFGDFKPEAQESTGYPMFPLSVGSNTTNMQGPIGDLYDWWSGRTSDVYPGDWVGNLNWVLWGDGSINVAPGASLAWPWDGVTIPQVA